MANDTDLTGNDYVSISSVRADGSLDGVTVLHGAMAGLVEWSGGGPDAPLMRPTVRIDDVAVPIAAARWRRLDRWIPTFTTTLDDGSVVSGMVCAPGSYPPARGFLVRIEIENRGRSTRHARIELDVDWQHTRLWIATPRPLSGMNHFHADTEAGLLVLEADGGHGPALAISGSGHTALTAGTGAEVPAAHGTPLRFQLAQMLEVTSQRRAAATFFVGVGRERDGAIAACRTLKRAGADALVRQARLDLSHTLRAAQDHRWAELLNRNLVFCRYFAAGRGIDDDRLYLVRSRSSHCREPGLFNEREALFWTIPALIVADPSIAREAILRALELFSERSGEYLRYLDGGAFDAGFVLDQFMLYPWVLDHYMTATGDTSLGDEPLAQQVILEADTTAFMRLHPQHMLGSTELLPSGEPADYPFPTVANALLRSVSVALDRLPWPAPPEPPARLRGAAAEITAAVWQHCVTEVDGQSVLASSADLEGRAAIYDDPAMSLVLLPFLGFCADDDPVWTGTMEFLRSRRYPLWRDGRVGGLAGRSDPTTPRFSALCADLLGPAAQDALDRLLRLRLPGGVAAAAYDPASGEGTLPHDAALAGFLAWALVRAAEPPPRAQSGKRRR
jgi:uncharacterized protein